MADQRVITGYRSHLLAQVGEYDLARGRIPSQRRWFRGGPVAVAGAAIYLVLPALIKVLGAWPRLSTLNPVWFTVALAAEIISFTCNFALQRLALRTKGWFAVITAGLAGNAVTNSLPGGDAAGAAVQFSPQPSLVLLAYAAAGIVALVPVTPGGLGIVEASLSGLLVLAGVRAGYAVLAVLAYRIASYWLPLLCGPPAYLLFRHRYGHPVPQHATPDADSQS